MFVIAPTSTNLLLLRLTLSPATAAKQIKTPKITELFKGSITKDYGVICKEV